MDPNPGPIDPSILHSQQTHRSQLVWEDSTLGEIHCRRRAAVVERTIPLHPLILPALRASGFYGVATLGFISLDWHFITALIERWRPETHTFHVSGGECTITLQDVSVLLGLPVDGHAVTGSMNYDWQLLCEQLLGVTPTASHLRGCRLSLPWLASQFPVLANDADDIAIVRYARAYILQLLGGTLLSDKSNNLVYLMFLPLLQDFEVAGRYSWGGACLAWMYRQLCKAATLDARDIAGPLILLQIWGWERFPTMAPQRRHIYDRELHGRPGGSRWKDQFIVTGSPTHVITQYRYMFDLLNPGMVIWEPYNTVMPTLPEYCTNGHDIWRTTSPLICFYIVEWHLPNRVMRQFGMKQLVPDICNTESELHSIDLRNQEWSVKLAPYLLRWDLRRNFVSPDTTVDDDEHTSPEYVFWYHNITRRYITREGAAYGEARSCFGRIRDLTLNLDILNLCDKGDKNMEQLHNMYKVPVLPPRPARRRGRAQQQVQDHVDENIHDEIIIHNMEDVPPLTQTQVGGSSQFHIGASSSYVPETEETDEQAPRRRQRNRTRRPPTSDAQ